MQNNLKRQHANNLKRRHAKQFKEATRQTLHLKANSEERT